MSPAEAVSFAMSQIALPAATAAVPMAVTAAAVALAMVPRTLLNFSNLLPASSAASPLSSNASAKSPVLSPAASISSVMPLMASSLPDSSRSMLLRAASALLSCICQFWVRRSFSPKDSAALSKAERRVSIFCFCASISLFSIWFRAVRASTEVSFLANWDCTSFISEPSTLKNWLISDRAALNSFSPSRPIFNPKLSANYTTSFVLAISISFASPQAARLTHSAARPLPTEPASLGFGGVPLKPCRDDLVNGQVPLCLAPAHELPVALPQIQQQAKRCQPHFVLGKTEVGDTVVEKPGEQFVTAYPACAFFVSGSLFTFRFVPRYMACMMASLHPARS